MGQSSISTKISTHLEAVYGSRTPAILEAIEQLIERYAEEISVRQAGWSERDALLITYGDSLLGDAVPPQALHDFLSKHVGDLFSFIHLLPFYPFTSDDGFAVQDFRVVRPDLGGWTDIHRLADDYRLVFDGVINHVSASSRYLQGFCAGDPEYADFFVALDPATDTSSVLRTRNLPLLHEYATSEGSRWLWTTFSRDQVDLNYANPKVLLEMLDVLLGYARHGASIIRLDAIPYLWKELNTSCVHLPSTHALIKLIRSVLDAVAPHVLLLTETNVPHKENITYFGERGDEAQIVYNFALPPLILWSLYRGDASVLSDWAQGLERIGDRATYLNITATHDGIGMRPTEGILNASERDELVQLAFRHRGDVTGKQNSDGSTSPYELNLNYFDAVNDPAAIEPEVVQIHRFLVSQAITMSLIGIPGIYLHSLLGSRNDYVGVKRSGRARSINRAQLRISELAGELSNPPSLRAQIFGAMKHLLTIRAQQPAFHPDSAQQVLNLGAAVFALRRESAKGQIIWALHNVRNTDIIIDGRNAGIPDHLHDLLCPLPVDHRAISLRPYQVRWLCE